MAVQAIGISSEISEQVYKQRVRAWTMYDWANSAFATTIMAAVLPIYYSQVAGATVPSEAIATGYWGLGLTISLLIAAIISPILGTVSDIMRGKKMFLAIFAGIGILSTGLLVLVQTGDWILASILVIIGRIGFNGANVFYDALLPHVARKDDQDRVSARGYAMGYLGGGILLAINVVMILFLPGTWGARLSFLSVAIWWAVFSIPIFLRVPEPATATARLEHGEGVFSASFKRLWETLKDMRQYRDLFLYLIAFLIYVDGIGTIINMAAIYGAELGFGMIEMVLALLLVQFVGIPYSLIFGRLPSRNEKRRPFFLAFVLFNLVALPLVGIAGRFLLPAQVTGYPPEPYTDTAAAVGQGEYSIESGAIQFSGAWENVTVTIPKLGRDQSDIYAIAADSGAFYEIPFNGQNIEIRYSTGPEQGKWSVYLDGQAYIDEESGEPLTIDAYHPTPRYGEGLKLGAASPGEHRLMVMNSGEANPSSQGTGITLADIIVLPPARQSSLMVIIGLILVIEVIGLLFSWLLGKPLFSGLAQTLDTKRSILLALLVYAVIAVWAYFLNSVIEFWFLAWMVAVVQGGSQALSRSLFSTMSPATKSGEFFGLFGIMEKFSGVIGPLIFTFAAAQFGNSRPAILSLIAFFVIGGFLLSRVNVAEGQRVAQQEDAALLAGASAE